MYNLRRRVQSGTYYLAWAMVVVGVLFYAHFDYGILNKSGFSLTNLGPIVALTGVALFSVNQFLMRGKNLGLAFLAVGICPLVVHVCCLFVNEGKPGDFLIQKEYNTPVVTELTNPVKRIDYFWSEVKIIKRKYESNNEYSFHWTNQNQGVFVVDYTLEMINPSSEGALRILGDKNLSNPKFNVHNNYHLDNVEERVAIISRIKHQIRTAYENDKNYKFTKLEVNFKN